MRYNPHAPSIIGEEWVPIRQASYRPSQEEERGYTFTIDHGAAIVSGAFNVAQVPDSLVSDQIEVIALYPDSTEDLTGPMQQVIIPASAITVTGDVFGDLADLLNPSDGNSIAILAGGGSPDSASLGVQFDVSAFQTALQGKRIVDVTLLYRTTNFQFEFNDPENRAFIVLARASVTSNRVQYSGISPDLTQMSETDLDSVNIFWTAGVQASTETRAYPWRWEELNLLDETAPAATKLQIIFDVSGGTPDPFDLVGIGYAALRVTFCEERRILYGGRVISEQAGYALGPSLVQLRTTALALPGTTAAGGYLVTHSHRQIAESRFSLTKRPPLLAAIRQLYEIPTMQSRIIELTETPGDQFVSARSDIVPYVTLHMSAAIVTGSHAYGTQISEIGRAHV